LAIEVLVFVLSALAALLLVTLLALLAALALSLLTGLASMLTRLSPLLTHLSAVLLHIVCHEVFPPVCASWRTHDLNRLHIFVANTGDGVWRNNAQSAETAGGLG
jgi:hypothetical protein